MLVSCCTQGMAGMLTLEPNIASRSLSTEALALPRSRRVDRLIAVLVRAEGRKQRLSSSLRNLSADKLSRAVETSLASVMDLPQLAWTLPLRRCVLHSPLLHTPR